MEANSKVGETRVVDISQSMNIWFRGDVKCGSGCCIGASLEADLSGRFHAESHILENGICYNSLGGSPSLAKIVLVGSQMVGSS